ncbi:hypothetical protein [Candidatus Parabeggiatoa sp. HSG14]|uniref:hypothetical protein n=1 Tax=Candidatus Parabeggiatoa sp. HSG14 TaxID=3055593 RepID=UPI0025A7EBC0|nr:hypothetical protein [Thiotrichales bacterium HSG14]
MKNVSLSKNNANIIRRTVKSHSPSNGFACQTTNIRSGMCLRTKEDGVKHIVCFSRANGWNYVQ